jgi:5-methylcytosine-specific restriction endonuclease McrA
MTGLGAAMAGGNPRMGRQKEEQPIVSFSDAKSQGLKHYFTGKSCKNGHFSVRLVSNRNCLACSRESLRIIEYKKNYYIKNAEKIKRRASLRWHTDEKARAMDKACRDRKREKIRAYDRMRAVRDREKKKEIIKRWIENNPDRYKQIAKAKSHRRRARIKGAVGNHSADDIQKMLKGQKGRCWWCLKKVGERYHVDHRIALARGGSNGPENLVIACHDCNRRKSDKLPHEFSGRLL